MWWKLSAGRLVNWLRLRPDEVEVLSLNYLERHHVTSQQALLGRAMRAGPTIANGRPCCSCLRE
jgi:hypothetical protein